MEFKDMFTMLAGGTWDTLYMVLISTLLGYVLGLPLGILLTITDVDGIQPNKVVYKILDIIINVAEMIGAVHLAKRWGKNRFVQDNWPLWIVLTVLVIFVIGYLTYNAPDWIIFRNLG